MHIPIIKITQNTFTWHHYRVDIWLYNISFKFIESCLYTIVTGTGNSKGSSQGWKIGKYHIFIIIIFMSCVYSCRSCGVTTSTDNDNWNWDCNQIQKTLLVNRRDQKC